MCIGIAISEFAGQLADAVLVAMAAGTFIYVGATEVIAEEFENPQDKWKKFFALSGERSSVLVCCFVFRGLTDIGRGPVVTKEEIVVKKNPHCALL